MRTWKEVFIALTAGAGVGLVTVLLGDCSEPIPTSNGNKIETPREESQGGTTVVIFPDGQVKPKAADVIAVGKPGEPLPHPLFPAK